MTTRAYNVGVHGARRSSQVIPKTTAVAARRATVGTL